jgi:hypothetical protein
MCQSEVENTNIGGLPLTKLRFSAACCRISFSSRNFVQHDCIHKHATCRRCYERHVTAPLAKPILKPLLSGEADEARDLPVPAQNGAETS